MLKGRTLSKVMESKLSGPREGEFEERDHAQANVIWCKDVEGWEYLG